MRIGIDCRELEASLTGIARILVMFLQQAKREKRNFEFVLFGNQETDFNTFRDVFEDYPKVVIREKFTLWWDQIQLRNALEKNRIDVFFSPYYKIPFLTRTKTIMSVFDLTYLLVEPYSKEFRNRFYIKNFIRWAARKAEKILTSSYSTKEDLSRILHLPSEKIEVIYLGVSPEFRAVPEKNKIELIKKKYGIPKKYILYAGNFAPHKNIKRLVEAFHLLPDALREEYCLVLGGGEPATLKLVDFESTVWPGYISEEDLPGLYSGAELFVFPSLYEGFGLPPLEAMACGCPVASSNTSSLPEVLGNGALFFNPEDVEEMSQAIQKMLLNREQRESFRHKGLKRSELFTQQKMTAELLSLFESLEGK